LGVEIFEYQLNFCWILDQKIIVSLEKGIYDKYFT
jgi:hypothetical protein